jgi:hypothetical protein
MKPYIYNKDGSININNINIGKLSREKVAKQIISGIHDINKISTIIDNIVYEFAWADKAFQDAFEDIKKKKSGELADFQKYVF